MAMNRRTAVSQLCLLALAGASHWRSAGPAAAEALPFRVPDVATFLSSSWKALKPGETVIAERENVVWQALVPDAPDFDLALGNSRFWVLPNDQRLVLEAFGVDGSASPTDFAGWQAATRAALRTGLRLIGKAGTTYLFDPFRNKTLVVAPKAGQTFWLDMQGATLKFADAMAPARSLKQFFNHQLLVSMRKIDGVVGQAAKLVRIENVVTDGNLRKQTDPRIGTVVAEQMAHLKVMCRASDGNSLDRLEIRNVSSIDPVADCILVGPSEDAARPDGRAAIASALLENLHAGARKSVRAFISIGSGAGHVQVRNVTSDPLTSQEGNSIETEFSRIGPQKVTLEIDNCEIDDFEFGGRKQKESQHWIHIRNSTARRFALFVFCNVSARNCQFGIGIRNAWQVREAVLENVYFMHGVFTRKDGRQDVLPLYFLSTASGAHAIKMVECRHEIAGTVGREAKSPLILFGPDAVGHLGSKRAEIAQAWFDPLAPHALSNRGGWAVQTSNCTMAGLVSGVVTGGLVTGKETYCGSWASHDDDFRAVTGLPFEAYPIAQVANAIDLTGGNWPSLNFGLTGPWCETFIRTSGRRLVVSTLPAFGGGLPGDEVWLDDAQAKKVSGGTPIKWICVGCGPGGTKAKAAQYRVLDTK